MIGGFFFGRTVAAVSRAKTAADKAQAKFKDIKAQAVADRQAAIRVAQEEIDALHALERALGVE